MAKSLPRTPSRTRRIGPAEIWIYENPSALASGAAALIAGFIRDQAAEMSIDRQVNVAMAGGSTPAATYREISALDVPWERVCAWVGDERYVAPDDPANNGTMIGQAIIYHTSAHFLPIPWAEDRSAKRAAEIYETQLLTSMTIDPDGLPRPDLILAGMGDDGHTLSLFPGSEALRVTDRWYIATEVAAPTSSWRLTATYPLVHRAKQIYVLVSGRSKSSALAEVLLTGSDRRLPARRLMEGEAPVTWLVDEAAASDL
ncbi:MAG: 6-phosphogluconolactonase [bacterium]|nr:6-phosphogluconolactonase [bacterium]MCY3580573.1 6-phosphogluconolactonase [bacterium]MCY3651831.1 6-phosphogluconolactonase [bacterium]MDE0642724.1 6-phosphogluconolactonase [bacterium]MYD04849.1 6-phosphogluconolactonase [Acidimicrobiia bacterium]